jgi:PmbA protein
MVASPTLTLVDDGTIVGGFGSAPFDGEGVPTRRTVVIGEGRLESYLLNSYAARKLGLRTTGNAARALAGAPGVSCGNLRLTAGATTPETIIGSVANGLYVTQFMGFGVNPVTGDYSRGACGIWIENGELAYPVEEITVAGNLQEMFRNIAAVGNDLVVRSAVSAPTLLIEGLTIAGS